MFCLAQRINRYKSLSSNNQRRPGGCGVQIIIIVVVGIVFDDSVQLRQHSPRLFSFWGGGGGLHPPLFQIYHPSKVSEAAVPPIRVMAFKAGLYSMIISKQLYTCTYTAMNCTIVTLANDRLDSRLVLWTLPPAPPYFKILVRTLN